MCRRSGDSNPNWIVTAWPPERGKILEWQWNEVLVPYWKDVANYAENLGVKICFELHGGDMVYNVPTTHRIRDQASKNIGANFDPSHLIWMGGDPVQMVKNLGEAVFYVHIKDVKIDPVQKSLNTLLDTTWFADVNGRSWNFCIPGHGHDERWWSEFLLALRSIGYEDVLSIEHEDCSLGRNEGMRLTIEFLERILINDAVDYEWSKEKINQLPLSLDIFLRKDSHLQSGDPCQDILLNKKFKWNFEKVKKYFNKALKEKKRTKVLTSKDQYISGFPDSYYNSDFSGLPDSYYNINFYLIDTKKFYKNKFLKSKIIFQLK